MDDFSMDDDGTSGQDRESYTDDQDRENYTVDEIEFVDPIRVVYMQSNAGAYRPDEMMQQTFYTCEVCCVLVRDDYMEGHRQWHQQ